MDEFLKDLAVAVISSLVTVAAETAIQSLCYLAVNGLGNRFPEWYQAQYGDAIDPMFQYGGVPPWLQEFLALISTAGAVPVILPHPGTNPSRNRLRKANSCL